MFKKNEGSVLLGFRFFWGINGFEYYIIEGIDGFRSL